MSSSTSSAAPPTLHSISNAMALQISRYAPKYCNVTLSSTSQSKDTQAAIGINSAPQLRLVGRLHIKRSLPQTLPDQPLEIKGLNDLIESLPWQSNEQWTHVQTVTAARWPLDLNIELDDDGTEGWVDVFLYEISVKALRVLGHQIFSEWSQTDSSKLEWVMKTFEEFRIGHQARKGTVRPGIRLRFGKTTMEILDAKGTGVSNKRYKNAVVPQIPGE